MKAPLLIDREEASEPTFWRAYLNPPHPWRDALLGLCVLLVVPVAVLLGNLLQGPGEQPNPFAQFVKTPAEVAKEKRMDAAMDAMLKSVTPEMLMYWEYLELKAEAQDRKHRGDYGDPASIYDHRGGEL